MTVIHCSCLQDIVGALYHCVNCESWGESVNICSNCEGAGLPGNLSAPDKEHSSSHIMIKIPVPMKPDELQATGRRAMQLLYERDAPDVRHVSRPPPQADSLLLTQTTSIAEWTSSSRESLASKASADDLILKDHKTSCDGCEKRIIGKRYQCAICPSTSHRQYNLCEQCEERSYLLHDPLHVFFKLPRPVDAPIVSKAGFLPILYLKPAGGPPFAKPANPKAYLQDIVHHAALCDRCMGSIRGEWFRCAYCSRDLCGACEERDMHDRLHLFCVFKAPIDMHIFRRKFAIVGSTEHQPVLKYPVYLS